jgi:hypothetical protein
MGLETGVDIHALLEMRAEIRRVAWQSALSRRSPAGLPKRISGISGRTAG